MPRCVTAPAAKPCREFKRKYQEECSRPIERTIITPTDLCPALEPPPFGQYYIYSNDPKAVRPNYKRTGKQRGGHDYHSMMWDPRIIRGPTYKSFKTAEEERCARKIFEDAAAANRRRNRCWAKRRLQMRPEAPSNQTTKNIGTQTDPFLEEFTDEALEKEECTQTDKAYEMPVHKIYCQTKMGQDAGTQVMPYELFSFDDEVKPIVTSLVGKIIEQSLIEIVQEDELEMLLKQVRVFEERRRIELLRLHRMHLREQKIIEERQQLIAQRQIEVEEEKETAAIISTALYATNYLCGVAQNAMDELRRLGFLSGNDDLNDSFIPWLHSRCIRRVGVREKSSLFLDEIIQAVVDTREAEVAIGIWREIAAEDNSTDTKRMSSNENENYENYEDYYAENEE